MAESEERVRERVRELWPDAMIEGERPTSPVEIVSLPPEDNTDK